MQEKQANQKNSNKPIGIFDSGFGGLTVMAAISKLMPKENLIYFGDSAHVPYGSKSKKVVTSFAVNISKFLESKDVKLIVVACNTASAFSLDTLKKIIKVPIIGVIEAGSLCAVKNSSNKRIGVIGTEGTIKSSAYVKEIKKHNNKINCFSKACPLFVPLVEEGWNKGKITEDIIKTYLKDLTTKKIDTLILGCTHYPLLKNSIQKIIGKKIKIIDSAIAVALAVKELLNEHKMLKNNGIGKHKFYVSDDPEKFKRLGSKFFNKRINKVIKVDL